MNNDCTYNSQFFEFEEEAHQMGNKSNPTTVAGAMEIDDDVDAPYDEADDVENQTPLWSIDDDTLFEPYGLINHSNDMDRSVFITWDDEYVLNFRFKKSKKTKRIEMTKVRIPLLPDAGEIREVHILDYNTLTLMTTGRIYYFSSVKSMQKLSWLSDVRCFSRAPHGFSIIRHDADTGRLLLEVYNDVASIGKSESTKTHSYDITYDEENVFNCAWRDEKFTLHSYEVKEEDVAFVQQLMGSEDNIICGGLILHIFSVNGHVFLLTANETNINSDVDMEKLEADTPAYQIVLLCIYATPVMFIKLLPQQNMCLVFLSSGSIDIWYVSSLTNLKQRQMHHTGTEFIDFDASSANGDFYYTDGEQLVRLRFQYNSLTDDCCVQEVVKFIEGMLACTWVQNMQQLVCLSSNNIFYRINFQSEVTPAAQQDDDIYKLNDLTPSEVNSIRAKATVVAEYQQMPAKLHESIEHEFQKQQLIAVASKTELYGQLFSASLSYCLNLPAFNAATVLFHTSASMQLTCKSYFALIEIKLNANNEIFQTALWQLCVFHDANVHVLHIPIDLLLKKRCIVVVPLKRSAYNKLAEFTLQFTTFLTMQSQIRALILPIALQTNGETYKGMFSQTTKALSTSNEQSIQEIVDNFRERLGLETKPRKATVPNIVQNFMLPANDSFEKMLETLSIKAEIDLSEEQLELYFLNNVLYICYEHATHILKISSSDATAIYYLKLHALLNWQKLCENAKVIPSGDDKQASLLQFVMKCQCEVERCYGTQIQTDFSEDEIKSNQNEHLMKLLSIYHKMRTELYLK